MTTLTHKIFRTVESEVTAPGSFVALVSTYTPDRQGERVVPGAFKASLERWVESGKMIPILANHDGVIGAVVGKADPRMSEETKQGLEVAGVLDTSTELGARVYELVKQGSLSWSIAFHVPDGGRRCAGKITELVEVDLVEVSVVSTPANADARTLSIKGLDLAEEFTELFAVPPRRDLSLDELREHYDATVKSLGIDTRPIRIVSFEC